MHTMITLAGISVWFAAGCLISHYAKKRMGHSVAEYFIANRRISGFIAAMTYSATTYSAFMMVGLVGMSYMVGVSAMGFELTYLISTVLLLLYFAPRFWYVGKEYNCVTPSELLAKIYKSDMLGGIVTVFSLFMLIPYMSVQFAGIGYLLEGLAKIPYTIGITVAFIIVITYTLWGGMKSVAWTDTLQSSIMIVSSVILLLYVVYSKFKGFGNFFVVLQMHHPELLSAENIPYQKFLGLAIPWMFFALTNPQVSQRMFIPRDKESLKNMIIGFSIFGLTYTLIVVNLGLAARCIYPNIYHTDMVTPWILSQVPSLLSLFVFLGIVAASVSTVNSITLTLSSMCTVDIFGKLLRTSERKQLLFGKLMIPLIAILAFLFAIGKSGVIVELSVMSSAGLLAVAPSYVGVLWKKSTKWGAIASILTGGIITATMYFTKQYPWGIWPGVWCAIVSPVIFIVVSLATRKHKHINATS